MIGALDHLYWVSDGLQWIGFAFVLYGYHIFRENNFRGAAITMVGTISLALWCFTIPIFPWGVFALQVGCAIINLKNLCR